MAAAPPIYEQDRHEAASVTGRGDGHHYEIQLGHLCNNRCVFCSSGQLSELRIAKRIPIDPIKQAIDEARDQGARRLTFLGGEPTLHKGFLDALRHAVDRGFEEIVIFTNGVMLPHPGFIDRVVALGKKLEWRISIQGANEQAHVAVTGRDKSFQRIVQGLQRLQELGQDVTANMCVNERSYRSLPEYPELVRNYGIRQLHVDVIRPQSAGSRTDEHFLDIMPRYSVMAPYFRQMLERFEQDDPEFDVNIGNLPYCILPEWGHRIHHGGEQTVTRSADDCGLEGEVDKYDWHASLRTHLPACDGCVFRPQCTGVFRDYLRLYGDDEFAAVSREQLEHLDPAQRNFHLLVQPWLEPVLGDPPQGWRRDATHFDAHERRVEVRFRSAHNGRVALTFVAPHGAKPPRHEIEPVLDTDRYRMGLELAGPLEGHRVARLLEWVEGALRGVPGITVHRTLDVRAVRQRLRMARTLHHGEKRVTHMAHQIERHAPFGNWRFDGTRPRHTGPGQVVSLHDDDGGRIELDFAVAAHDGRSQVHLDVTLGGATAPDHARPAIEQVTRLLRELERGTRSPTTTTRNATPSDESRSRT